MGISRLPPRQVSARFSVGEVFGFTLSRVLPSRLDAKPNLIRWNFLRFSVSWLFDVSSLDSMRIEIKLAFAGEKKFFQVVHGFGSRETFMKFPTEKPQGFHADLFLIKLCHREFFTEFTPSSNNEIMIRLENFPNSDLICSFAGARGDYEARKPQHRQIIIMNYGSLIISEATAAAVEAPLAAKNCFEGKLGSL